MKANLYKVLLTSLTLFFAIGCGKNTNAVTTPAKVRLDSMNGKIFSSDGKNQYSSQCAVDVTTDGDRKRVVLTGHSGSTCVLSYQTTLLFLCDDNLTCTNSNNYGTSGSSRTFSLVLLTNSDFTLVVKDKSSAAEPEVTREMKFTETN